MSSILDFRGLYFCAAYIPANNLRRISTIYLRGYWKGSENGRVVTIGILCNWVHVQIFCSSSVPDCMYWSVLEPDYIDTLY